MGIVHLTRWLSGRTITDFDKESTAAGTPHPPSYLRSHAVAEDLVPRKPKRKLHELRQRRKAQEKSRLETARQATRVDFVAMAQKGIVAAAEANLERAAGACAFSCEGLRSC